MVEQHPVNPAANIAGEHTHKELDDRDQGSGHERNYERRDARNK